MPKLTSLQTKVVESLKSKASRKTMKKAFKEINQEKQLLDSKKLLKKLFKSFQIN